MTVFFNGLEIESEVIFDAYLDFPDWENEFGDIFNEADDICEIKIDVDVDSGKVVMGEFPKARVGNGPWKPVELPESLMDSIQDRINQSYND